MRILRGLVILSTLTTTLSGLLGAQGTTGRHAGLCDRV